MKKPHRKGRNQSRSQNSQSQKSNARPPESQDSNDAEASAKSPLPVRKSLETPFGPASKPRVQFEVLAPFSEEKKRRTMRNRNSENRLLKKKRKNRLNRRQSQVLKKPQNQPKKLTEDRIHIQPNKHLDDLKYVEGLIKCHPDGYGFLIPDDPKHPDIYISRQFMTSIMTNDRLRVLVHRSRNEDRLSGEVVEVLSRAVKKVVGKFLPVDVKYGVILDENRNWGSDLRIRSEDSMGAKEGDVVVVEIIGYPGRNQDFTGKVIDIIGDSEDPMNDVIRVIHLNNIPFEFSPAAIKQAEAMSPYVSERDMAGRKDLRDKNLITIDGATAKDFDDAVYTEVDKSGFTVWVAIADVSHYVKPGSPIDDDAYERGTSTYFPNFVVPMLPEALSNELCSLKPKVARLCFVCEMQMDFQGNIISHEFYEAVMESKARVTYGQAQEILDGKTPSNLNHVEANIKNCRDIAKILMAKRHREGSLDLEIPETQVIVNEAGEAIDIIKSERLFAHRLIEELMLAANISVGRFLSENNMPGIYRIHEEPNEEKIAELQKFLWNFGAKGGLAGKDKLQNKITRTLESFKGKPEQQILSMLTLRAMNQAKYSSANLGHFGLGFSHYSHFTSPIRRYPDLIAHRLIKSMILPAYKNEAMTEDDLATASSMLSACEQRSVKAERKLVSIKKARFMQKFVGEKYDGVITSVARFGIFVTLRAFDVDGLVKIENLGDDRFTFEPEMLMLLGSRTKKKYKIGDAIEVFVSRVDIDAGKIDFKLSDEEFENVPEVDDNSNEGSEENRSDSRKNSGRDKLSTQNRRKKKGRAIGQNEKSQKTGEHPKKRGTDENDSRGVRKKRFPKRRRKN